MPWFQIVLKICCDLNNYLDNLKWILILSSFYLNSQGSARSITRYVWNWKHRNSSRWRWNSICVSKPRYKQFRGLSSLDVWAKVYWLKYQLPFAILVLLLFRRWTSNATDSFHKALTGGTRIKLGLSRANQRSRMEASGYWTWKAVLSISGIPKINVIFEVKYRKVLS